MDWWIAEAMDLAQLRAPLLDDEFAADLAENLQHTWPDDTPAEALAKFFDVLPTADTWIEVTRSFKCYHDSSRDIRIA